MGDPVYKVDTIDSRQEAAARGKALTSHGYRKLIDKERQRERIRTITAQVVGPVKGHGPGGPSKSDTTRTLKRPAFRHEGRRAEPKRAEQPLPWWLKIDDFAILRQMPRHSQPARIVALLTRETLRQFRHLSLSLEQRRGLIWALPPVILEGDLEFYRQAIAGLGRQGFFDWQVSHIGHRRLLDEAIHGAIPTAEEAPGPRRPGAKKRPLQPRRLKLTLFGHYTLNVLNSQALKALANAGISSAQVSIEVDRGLLAEIGQAKQGQQLGLTIFGFPPLFTARPNPSFFSYDQKFVSPKGEGFVLKRSFEQTVAVPTQPFSLLDRQEEIKAAGIDYVVIDLTANLFKRGDLALLWRRLEGGHSQERLSSFNYRGNLQ